MFSALPKCSLLQAITDAPSNNEARFIFLLIIFFDFAIEPYNLNLATPPSGKILNLI
jgi:hypothetical protein